MINLNPYKITHTFLFPLKGIATKKDEKKSSFRRSTDKTHLWFHSASKERAEERLKELQLSKRYKILNITDKQMGNVETNGNLGYNDLIKVATTKQLTEMEDTII